jgi:BirA family transcriptional regulator, biotin operon repressor / biotin---[acetyl-CoA-carboxylase] ligase
MPSPWQIETLAECGSTNTDLMAAARAGAPHGKVLRALRQTAGRGRRGNAWHAPEGGSLTFSLLWRFPLAAQQLGGLSLAIGLAVAEALDTLGGNTAQMAVRLKWPNDVVIAAANAAGYAKLCGILVEIQPDGAGTAAVIGIGLNIDLGTFLPEIAYGATDLRRLAGSGRPITADVAFHALLDTLGPTLARFGDQGFAPFRAKWEARHLFAGRAVELRDNHTLLKAGIALGVDISGALLIQVDDQVEAVHAGEVSLRLAQ